MSTPAWLTPAVRKWLYGIAVVVMPLLITYGVVDASRGALWLAIVGAVLVPGLAFANTDTSTPNGMPGAEAAHTVTVGPDSDQPVINYDPLHD